VKERPILFSAPMVRAVLDGSKTQTRRVVKDKHIDAAPPVAFFQYLREHCPYGQLGDRLWVRETFMHSPADYCWEASVSIPCRQAETAYRADFPDIEQHRGVGWSPSIHMPRGLSRIDLEITGVRVERLQDISEQDAIAEGTAGGHGAIPGYGYNATPTEHYRWLWESLNGPGSWDANPWVWVIEFRRIK
jgi:hypothetical protein